MEGWFGSMVRVASLVLVVAAAPLPYVEEALKFQTITHVFFKMSELRETLKNQQMKCDVSVSYFPIHMFMLGS